MRLIDADKLENDIVENITVKAVSRMLAITQGQPTVKAIPIEWITKWAEKFYKVINGKRYYIGDGYDTIWDLLEDWERESQYGKD